MDTIWTAVDRIVGSASKLADLRRHRVQLLAARRWRALGRQIPPELLEEEHWAGVVALTTPLLLEKARAACDGPLVILKGPEVASYYPNPTLRPWRDIDLLVPNAEKVQQALLDAGFKPAGHEELYVDIHHLRPLRHPALPLALEIHSKPKWPARLEPPRTEELLAVARPASADVKGILALPPAHHALLLAAHAWAHEPLTTLSELIDVTAVAESADRDEIESLARRWRMTKLWRTTIAASDALLLRPGRHSWPLRTWARHLAAVRERTVFETHSARLLSSFWGLPWRAALGATSDALVSELRRQSGESWRTKLLRTTRAVRNASVGRSAHDQELGRDQLAAPSYLEQLRMGVKRR